jgi:outer membrane murein-binding lipoprotein Lpp
VSEGVIVALITGASTILAVIVSGMMTRKQVAGVHEIVNNQRTLMVAEIDTLKAQVVALRGAIDAAREVGKAK